MERSWFEQIGELAWMIGVNVFVDDKRSREHQDRLMTTVT
jgi:hypothetical protein